MMITMLFYLDLTGKNFCQKFLKSKNFKQTLCHQVVDAEAAEVKALMVEAQVIQKLPLPHPCIERVENRKHDNRNIFYIHATKNKFSHSIWDDVAHSSAKKMLSN